MKRDASALRCRPFLLLAAEPAGLCVPRPRPKKARSWRRQRGWVHHQWILHVHEALLRLGGIVPRDGTTSREYWTGVAGAAGYSAIFRMRRWRGWWELTSTRITLNGGGGTSPAANSTPSPCCRRHSCRATTLTWSSESRCSPTFANLPRMPGFKSCPASAGRAHCFFCRPTDQQPVLAPTFPRSSMRNGWARGTWLQDSTSI